MSAPYKPLQWRHNISERQDIHAPPEKRRYFVVEYKGVSRNCATELEAMNCLLTMIRKMAPSKPELPVISITGTKHDSEGHLIGKDCFRVEIQDGPANVVYWNLGNAMNFAVRRLFPQPPKPKPTPEAIEARRKELVKKFNDRIAIITQKRFDNPKAVPPVIQYANKKYNVYDPSGTLRLVTHSCSEAESTAFGLIDEPQLSVVIPPEPKKPKPVKLGSEVGSELPCSKPNPKIVLDPQVAPLNQFIVGVVRKFFGPNFPAPTVMTGVTAGNHPVYHVYSSDSTTSDHLGRFLNIGGAKVRVSSYLMSKAPITKQEAIIEAFMQDVPAVVVTDIAEASITSSKNRTERSIRV